MEDLTKLLQRVKKCDRCKEDFIQKLVIAQKAWSQINEVDYWTDGKGWKEFKFLCRSCLKSWREEDRKDFNSLVKLNKRKIFLNYLGYGTFNKNDKI